MQDDDVLRLIGYLPDVDLEIKFAAILAQMKNQRIPRLTLGAEAN